MMMMKSSSLALTVLCWMAGVAESNETNNINNIADAVANATTNKPVTSMEDDGGSTYLTITFRRRIGGALVNNTWEVDGITYRVEVNDSLDHNAWAWDALSVEWDPVATNNGDGTETASARFKTAVGSADDDYYIRLMVFETP